MKTRRNIYQFLENIEVLTSVFYRTGLLIKIACKLKLLTRKYILQFPVEISTFFTKLETSVTYFKSLKIFLFHSNSLL